MASEQNTSNENNSPQDAGASIEKGRVKTDTSNNDTGKSGTQQDDDTMSDQSSGNPQSKDDIGSGRYNPGCSCQASSTSPLIVYLIPFFFLIPLFRRRKS